ncbi:MAG: phosphotransferase, partial [Dermatophilaceae bacterium]
MSTAPSPASVAIAPRPPVDAVTEILACRADGPRIGEFLRERVPAVIVDSLARVLDDGGGPITCTVTRSKLKPQRRLTVSAELYGLGPAPRQVSAVWGALPVSFAAGSEDPMIPAAARGPFASLRVVPAGESVSRPVLLVAPLDPAFPSLPALHDPVQLAGVLRTQGVEVGPDELSLTTLRYRPGQRHVLRVDLAGSGRSIFAKCYRDDTGAAAAAARRRVATALATCGVAAEPVSPVGYVASERVMLWEGSAGTRLGEAVGEAGVESSGESLAHLRTAGAALRSIHDSPVSDVERTRSSDVDRELAATLRSCEHVSALLPGPGAALTALAADASRRIACRPAETGHLLHGDFKCDNILLEQGDRLRLLDLDRVTLGDPA